MKQMVLILMIFLTKGCFSKDFTGIYYIHRPGFSGGIELKRTEGNKYIFDIDMINWQFNTGLLDGEIEFKNKKAVFKYKNSSIFGCYLSLKVEGEFIYIYQKHGEGGGICGAELNVEYTGVYKKGTEPIGMIEEEEISIEDIRKKFLKKDLK